MPTVTKDKSLDYNPLDFIPADFKVPRKGVNIAQVFGQLEKYKIGNANATREQYLAADAKQILWLRHNNKPVLRYLLRLAFEPVEWYLPKGLPPYKPLQLRRGKKLLDIRPGMAPTELMFEARRLYLFIKGAGADNMDRMKREKVFQMIIEDMEPIEVDVLLCIKDRKMHKFVSKDLVAAAFPGIFTAPFSPKFLRG